jgi:phosphoglycolate phosphatase
LQDDQAAALRRGRHAPADRRGGPAQRWQLVEVARARAAEAGSGPVAPADTWVIGDTPLDVAAAKQAGVRSLAVATGGYSTVRLQESGADVVLPLLAVDALPF